MRGWRWARCACAAALAPALVQGAEPAVRAEASKTEVTVGETFTVALELAGPEGTVWRVPDRSGDGAVELRLRKALPAASSGPDAQETDSHVYEAAAFAVGEAEVPAISVGFRLPDGTEGELATEPIGLRIVSVLPKDPEEQKLVDIRDPLAVSIGRAFWVGLAAVVLVVGALAVWLIRRRRRAPVVDAAPEPPIPPDAEALEALDRLAKAGLASRTLLIQYEAFCEEPAQWTERLFDFLGLDFNASFMHFHPRFPNVYGNRTARDFVYEYRDHFSDKVCRKILSRTKRLKGWHW